MPGKQEIEHTINELFRCISSNGTEEVGPWFAPDGVYEGIYYPFLLDGRDAITKMFRNCIPTVINPLAQWPVEIYHVDTDRCVVEYQSKGTILRNGGSYQNRYLAPVHFNADAEITFMNEYFNPILWNAAIGPEFIDVLKREFPEGLTEKSLDDQPWLSDPNE
jgi:ketosteroid isomerase-like protein